LNVANRNVEGLQIFGIFTGIGTVAVVPETADWGRLCRKPTLQKSEQDWSEKRTIAPVLTMMLMASVSCSRQDGERPGMPTPPR